LPQKEDGKNNSKDQVKQKEKSSGGQRRLIAVDWTTKSKEVRPKTFGDKRQDFTHYLPHPELAVKLSNPMLAIHIIKELFQYYKIYN